MVVSFHLCLDLLWLLESKGQGSAGCSQRKNLVLLRKRGRILNNPRSSTKVTVLSSFMPSIFFCDYFDIILKINCTIK